MLEPILFDEATIGRWGSGKRAHGLRLLTTTLVQSCVLGIAKIALDKDERTPSISKLVAALADERMVDGLREEFAIWHLAPTTGDDAEVIALLQKMERREEEERRAQFNRHLAELLAGWSELSASAPLKSFGIMRNKLVAHSEIWHDGEKYRPVDITSLGLKFADLRTVITSLQRLIDLINLIYRNASFDFEMLDKQLNEAKNQFWQSG
jgi:hypothetical protein